MKTAPPLKKGRHGQSIQTANKQSKHRAESRPRPSANCRFDGSVGVFASLAAVMSPMRQLLAFVKRCLQFINHNELIAAAKKKEKKWRIGVECFCFLFRKIYFRKTNSTISKELIMVIETLK